MSSGRQARLHHARMFTATARRGFRFMGSISASSVAHCQQSRDGRASFQIIQLREPILSAELRRGAEFAEMSLYYYLFLSY